MHELTDDQLMGLEVGHIWNCPKAAGWVCPRWRAMDPTPDPATGLCPGCGQPVYESRTPLDFVSHGDLGRCVAIPEGHGPLWYGMAVRGHPPPGEEDRHRDRERAVWRWWEEVLEMRPQFSGEAFAALRHFFRRRRYPFADPVGPDDSRPK